SHPRRAAPFAPATRRSIRTRDAPLHSHPRRAAPFAPAMPRSNRTRDAPLHSHPRRAAPFAPATRRSIRTRDAPLHSHPPRAAPFGAATVRERCSYLRESVSIRWLRFLHTIRGRADPEEAGEEAAIRVSVSSGWRFGR